MFSKTYLTWLVLVIIWNYGFPDVKPIADVIIAILLSILSKRMEKFIN